MSEFKGKPELNKKESGKKVAMKRVCRLLDEQMAYVLENISFSQEEKMAQISVYLTTKRFLSNYDEIAPILNKLVQEKNERGSKDDR